MENISKKVLAEIDNKKIKPKCKLWFVFKDVVFWFVGLVSLWIGSISVAMIIFWLANRDILFFSRAFGYLKTLLIILPYFWLVLFVLFILLAYYNLRHVQGGYKIRLFIVAFVFLLVTIFTGTVLYFVGVGNFIENRLTSRIPLYETTFQPGHQKFLNQPQKGIIIGVIEKVMPDNLLVIDVVGEKWAVDIKNANIQPLVVLEPGKMIKIFGQITFDSNFQAKLIGPYMHGRGKMHCERNVCPKAYY